jgi:hypothetical protein
MMTDLSNPSVIAFRVSPVGKGFTAELLKGGEVIATFEGKPVTFEQAYWIGKAMDAAAKSQRKP